MAALDANMLLVKGETVLRFVLAAVGVAISEMEVHPAILTLEMIKESLL